MNTREEEIRQVAEQYECDLFKMRGINRYDSRDIIQVAKDFAEWADEHPKNPWRNAKIELPVEKNVKSISIDCFIRTSKGLYFSAFYDYQFKDWYIDGHGYSSINTLGYVTHWMPIPETPKGGEE